MLGCSSVRLSAGQEHVFRYQMSNSSTYIKLLDGALRQYYRFFGGSTKWLLLGDGNQYKCREGSSVGAFVGCQLKGKYGPIGGILKKCLRNLKIL